MLVLIDNFDSFTYNIFQYLGDLGLQAHVVRNNACTADDVLALKPSGIIISPGPCDPDQAGISLNVVDMCLANDIPLLGICLGHQAIGQALGADIVKTAPYHGKVSKITHDGSTLFQNLPSPLPVTRYHSLVIHPKTCPDQLQITARTDDDIIMAIQHKTALVYGVQFHPESIATHDGQQILKNFTDRL